MTRLDDISKVFNEYEVLINSFQSDTFQQASSLGSIMDSIKPSIFEHTSIANSLTDSMHPNMFEPLSSLSSIMDSLQPNILEQVKNTNKLYNDMLEVISLEPTEVLNYAYEPSKHEFITTVTILEEDNNSNILEKFQQLSLHLKIYLMWVLEKIILTLFLSLIASYIYDNIKNNLNKPAIQQIRDIKKVPKRLNLKIDTTYYRFIAVDSLNVRTKPSTTKSKIIGNLTIGNIVKVLDKRKNWIKVNYSDKANDITLQGWVFTRYTHKFEN